MVQGVEGSNSFTYPTFSSRKQSFKRSDILNRSGTDPLSALGALYFLGFVLDWFHFYRHPCTFPTLPRCPAVSRHQKTSGKLGSEKGSIAPQPGGCGKLLAPSRKRLSHYSHDRQLCLTTGERSATQ